MTPAAAMVLVINAFHESGHPAASERTLTFFREAYMQRCVDRARQDVAVRSAMSERWTVQGDQVAAQDVVEAAQTYLDSIIVLVTQPEGDTTTMAAKKTAKKPKTNPTVPAPSAALVPTPAPEPAAVIIPPAAESATGKVKLADDLQAALMATGPKPGPLQATIAHRLADLGLVEIVAGGDAKGPHYALTDAGKTEKQRAKWREEARREREAKAGGSAQVARTAKKKALAKRPGSAQGGSAARTPAAAPTPAKGLVAKPTSITALARAVDDAQAVLDQARATLRKALGS